MKTNGATWKQYLESWSLSQWYDDSNETIDGVSGDDLLEEIPDTAVVEFNCGVVYRSSDDHEGVSLVSHFRKWLKTLTLTTLVCEVPTTKLNEFTMMLTGMGGNRVS